MFGTGVWFTLATRQPQRLKQLYSSRFSVAPGFLHLTIVVSLIFSATRKGGVHQMEALASYAGLVATRSETGAASRFKDICFYCFPPAL